MKFNGDLGPEKNQTHHERKNEKKSSRHGETAFKQKCKNEPNNQPDEDENKERNANVMSQGMIRERNKKNVNNDKQVFTFCFFN